MRTPAYSEVRHGSIRFLNLFLCLLDLYLGLLDLYLGLLDLYLGLLDLSGQQHLGREQLTLVHGEGFNDVLDPTQSCVVIVSVTVHRKSPYCGLRVRMTVNGSTSSVIPTNPTHISSVV